MTNLLNSILLMTTPAGGSGSGFAQLLPLLMIVVVFYFFMIRPQMKKSKELKKFISEIQKGDKVLTLSGIHGKIVEMQETTVTLEIENGRMRVEKSAIVNSPENVQSQAK
ncbi:MAG: preprotein translocase subunit YajC [Bacteroidota bacterium]